MDHQLFLGAAAEAPGRSSVAGALCFGIVIGWFLYYVGRHRSDRVGITDVAALISALGGGAITSLFPASTTLFGWYGIGLACGFFGYFIVLIVAIMVSRRFTVDFLLDGRVPSLKEDEMATRQRPLGDSPAAGRKQ